MLSVFPWILYIMQLTYKEQLSKGPHYIFLTKINKKVKTIRLWVRTIKMTLFHDGFLIFTVIFIDGHKLIKKYLNLRLLKIVSSYRIRIQNSTTPLSTNIRVLFTISANKWVKRIVIVGSTEIFMTWIEQQTVNLLYK